LSQFSKTSRRMTVLALVLWATGAAAVLLDIEQYKTRPGDAGATPLHANAPPTAVNRPWLRMFVHPRCPCTRASVAELRNLLAASPADVYAEVVLTLPAGAPDDWRDAPIAAAAQTIPGVIVRCDEGGVEAARFGVQTSGHVLLYSAEGSLQFSGGITRSRGHEGDSTGSRAVAALLRRQRPVETQSAVFGCPLVANHTTCCTNPTTPVP
jgi:hypothetical protein